MPGDRCHIVRRFHEQALQAADDNEVVRLMEQARQILESRGFHCTIFSCLSETLVLVREKRAKRELPSPQLGSLLNPTIEIARTMNERRKYEATPHAHPKA